MAKRTKALHHDKTDRWLITYADMMNNLLILFMVMYAMSVMDLKKFEALKSQLSNAFNTPPASQSANGGTSDSTVNGIDFDIDTNSVIDVDSGQLTVEPQDSFDAAYDTITKEITEKGYDGMIVAEKGDNYIVFRFKDSVLFYPDSSTMKSESAGILTDMGDVLMSVDNVIGNIEIGGHTATVSGGETSSFFAWQLSSDRAIAVLQFLSEHCSFPQSKMSVSGYSHYRPVSSNDTEESRSLNRRVEIKITRVSSK